MHTEIGPQKFGFHGTLMVFNVLMEIQFVRPADAATFC